MFSHAQTVVLCVSCSTVLAQPTGGRARLTEGEHMVTVSLIFMLITIAPHMAFSSTVNPLVYLYDFMFHSITL